jgi:hypothetical protein
VSVAAVPAAQFVFNGRIANGEARSMAQRGYFIGKNGITYGRHRPDCLSDAIETIAMHEHRERKAHESGAVVPLRQNNTE